MNFWGNPIAIDVTATNPVDSDVSTRETISKMIALARSASNHPTVVSAVSSCLKSLPVNATNRDLVRAIYWYVKGKLTFCEDEQTLTQRLGWKDPYQELLIHPAVLLTMPQPMGDCDDYCMLLAAMLLCARIPCCYVTIAVDPVEPNRWSHVYCKAWLTDENSWLALDASHGTLPGWEKKECYRKQEWLVS